MLGTKDEEQLKSLGKKYMRQFLAVSCIWFLGWFGFSLSWIFISFVSWLVWNHLTEKKKEKLQILRTITQDEKGVLLNMRDLPSWRFIAYLPNRYFEEHFWRDASEITISLLKVCFPEVERAEWLNQMIEQLWPFLSTMISDILKNKIEPEIQKGHSFLKSFKFEEVDLGNRPLKLGGIRVYTEHVRPNEIIMDAELIYAGDADLKVSLNGVVAGISDLHIRGTVRIEINPLLTKPPLVGAISIYFLDDPDFDFDLTNLLNLFDFPGLSAIVKKIIGEVIEKYLVLPNRQIIQIGNELDLDSLKYPLPLGALRVQILEATDLVAEDSNLLKKDSSDPYVICKVGAFKYRTKTKKETLKPKWTDESFITFVYTMIGSQLHIELYDEDKLNKDDKLGRVDIELPKLSHSSSEDLWLPLKDTKSGNLHVICGWNDFSDDASILKESKVSDENEPTSCLFVKLEHAKGLPATDMDSDTTSSYIEITVGNIKVETKTQRNTKNPVWEELHSFFISNPHFQTVNFKVLDKDADGPLGILEVPISHLLTSPGMKVKQAFPLKECFTNGELYMALELKALVPPKAASHKE